MKKIMYTYALAINKGEEVVSEQLKRNNTIIYDYKESKLRSTFLDEKNS